MYNTFLEDHFKPTGQHEKEESGENYSPALYLKKYISERVSEVLSEAIKWNLEHEKHHEPKANRKKVQEKTIEERSTIHICDIEFAYNNNQMIELLKTRGTAITALDFETVKKTDAEIQDLVTNPNNYNKLTTPVVAFITFESDDGFNTALSYSKKKKWYQSEHENEEDGPVQ